MVERFLQLISVHSLTAKLLAYPPNILTKVDLNRLRVGKYGKE